MLAEQVETYYLGQGYNCAEAMLRGIRDVYQLPLSDDSLPLVSGFGGGMHVGHLCGAVAGAVAGLGAMLVKDKGREAPGFAERCQELMENMLRDLGTDQCHPLKEAHFQEQQRCWAVVEQAANTFEQFAREAGLAP